jgi:hypothetical protein
VGPCVCGIRANNRRPFGQAKPSKICDRRIEAWDERAYRPLELRDFDRERGAQVPGATA